ncbi:hypothetical protein ACFXDJ_06270 [Streptomyces sp. NPDC059443]|uniref:hypothetical protein n=1 Tax=unclassified Streptomyces TaxID=2593676 RepID=UPI0036AC724E
MISWSRSELLARIGPGAAVSYWGRAIASPLRPTTPDKSGWSETGGYYLDTALIPVFAEALDRVARHPLTQG